MVKFSREHRGLEVSVPRVFLLNVQPDLGGMPNNAFEFTVWLEFFGRFVVDFDFLINLDVRRVHRAPNGDIHPGKPEDCTWWPCVPSEFDDIPF